MEDADPFCILPTNSYFGDYYVLKDIPCFYQATALSADEFSTNYQSNKKIKNKDKTTVVATIKPIYYQR